MPETETMSVPDVMKFLAEQNRQNQEALLAAIKELKKPSEFEQRKIDKENEVLRNKQMSRLTEAKAEVERKEMRMRNCPHAAAHPMGYTMHLWGGQAHTPANQPAYFVPTCGRCQTQLPKVYCTPEQLTQGINLYTYKNIGIEDLLKAAEHSGNVKEVKEFREIYNRKAA